MIRSLLTASVSMLLVSGCATVRTTPYLQKTASQDDAISGLTYRLPMVQYDLRIVRTLAECPGEIGGRKTILKFSTDVFPTRRYVPGEGYTLDPRLVGLLKTSSLEINYFPNGTLKSIGIAADDRTGQVIENTAKLAAAGLMLTAGVPPIAVSAGAVTASLTNSDSAKAAITAGLLSVEPGGPEQVVCTAEAIADLKALADAEQELKTAAGALAIANVKMRDFVEEVALRIKRPGDDEVIEERRSLLGEQREAAEAIALASEVKATILGRISASEEITWPRAFDEARLTHTMEAGDEVRTKLAKLVRIARPVKLSVAAGIDKNALPELLSSDQTLQRLERGPDDYAALSEIFAETGASDVADGDIPSECTKAPKTTTDCLRKHLDLTVSVDAAWPLATGGTCPKTEDAAAYRECVEMITRTEKVGDAGKREKPGRVQHARNDAYDEGIFVRELAEGKLRVCRTAKTVAGACSKSVDLASIEPANFPQLGQLRFLRFNVPIFQAKDMGVFLTADGRVERYYMKSTKAALETATASAANAATTVADALEKRETERQSDLTYTQSRNTQALTAQISELEAKAKLAALQKTPSADPLQPVRDAAAEDQVYIERLQAQLVRQQLQSAIDTQDDAATRALLDILRRE